MPQSLGSFSVWPGVLRLGTISASYWAAFLLRFDFLIPADVSHPFRRGLAIAVATKMIVFYAMRLDRERWWRYFGFSDVIRLIEVNSAASAAFTVFTLIAVGPAFPRSIYCLDFLLCFLASVGARSGLRLWRESHTMRRSKQGKPLLIYGAGVAGITLAREIRANPDLGYRVVGFLDDDPRKSRAVLIGLPVLGTGQDAASIVATTRERGPRIEEIVITIPSATGRQIRAALARVRDAGVPCRVVPGLGELISGKLSVGKLREVSVSDLLCREPVQVDLESVRRSVAGCAVLVTGAAGSIGSELCNQLADFEPRCLIALEQAESELFRLEADLRPKYPSLNVQFELGDIREPARLDEILDKYAVNSIFHAAAYKHVPMLERHIREAAKNNVLGTWYLVEAACRKGVSTFVMISSDKAVNPTSVMGVSKRIAELIVTAKRNGAQGAIPRFVCLRFGNVLVSNGSVVPTFQKQIAAGGPVTVTHPEMRRYFMTVQEAVQLVLHASAMGMQSEILVLDMGSPVRILDLARKMITLAGFVPDEDIEIRFTGLRPGEKLFEELKIDSESVLPSANEKIKIFRGEQLTIEEIGAWITKLRSLLERGEPSMLLEHFRRLVPEYCGTLIPAQEPLSASSPGRHAATVAYTATQAAAS